MERLVIVSLCALALGLFGGLKLQDGAVARAEAERDRAREVSTWNYNQAIGWQAAKGACEANRDAEQTTNVKGADDALEMCTSQLAQMKRSRSALDKLLAKPVKVDAKGHPQEEILWAKDLGWGPHQ